MNSWFQKSHGTQKKWHAMTNIGAINLRHTKTYSVTKNYGLPWKFVTSLLPNDMPCHHHMEDQVVINHKGPQYLQLTIWD